MPRDRTKPPAFTLIEVLVVITIIAALIAILLPALGRAREAGKAVKCLSGLRQMTIASGAYVGDYSGSYPMAYYYSYPGGITVANAWDLTTIDDPGGARVVPGVLWQSEGAAQIQQCPSFGGGANWLVDPHTGYNYNTSYVGHGEYESIVAPARAESIRRPAGTAIFGDGEYAAGANKFMRAPFDSEGDDAFNGRWAGTQGFRHRMMTNAAFCDGHAESLRDRYTQTDDHGGAANIAPDTGFLSPDNRMYGGN